MCFSWFFIVAAGFGNQLIQLLCHHLPLYLKKCECSVNYIKFLQIHLLVSFFIFITVELWYLEILLLFYSFKTYSLNKSKKRNCYCKLDLVKTYSIMMIFV